MIMANTKPVVKKGKTPPLFNPLHIEYSWEGCFEYDRLNDGHYWKFCSAELWKRVHLEVKRGCETIIKIKTKKPLSLTQSAKRYKNQIQKDFLKSAEKISGKKIENNKWQLVKWLNDTDQINLNVGSGLSLVLNALVGQSTTKPFDLLSTFVGEHITVNVRDLGAHVPCWFYIRAVPFADLDEYLVCFPELFLETSGEGKDSLHSGVAAVLKSLMHVRCKHHYEVIRIEQNDKKIKIIVRDNAVISEYTKGAICGCIPVPGQRPKNERKEPEGVNAPEVLATSPVVGDALEALSRVWQDPYAKSVLISSPPGSGKEVFANSIPVGNGRPADKIISLSMASDDQKGLERQLYGFAHPDGSIQDGLIAKASDAALFLDEVHQPEKEKTSAARASLLRTLEAGTYFPQESVTERSVKNVLWVMATSKTPVELKDFKPIDFWTRMTHSQVIPHPLHFHENLKEGHTHLQVVADFFRLFWWNLCDTQYQIDPTSNFNDLKINFIPAYWQQRAMLAVIVAKDGNRVDQGKDWVFASLFMSFLKGKEKEPHLFSIRGIRNVVSRLFAIAWSNVAQGRDPWEKLEFFKKNVKSILDEIYPVAILPEAVLPVAVQEPNP